MAAVLMFFMFVSELGAFLQLRLRHEVLVDPSVGERLRIHFNVTFHALSCVDVNLDSMDVAGEQVRSPGGYAGPSSRAELASPDQYSRARVSDHGY